MNLPAAAGEKRGGEGVVQVKALLLSVALAAVSPAAAAFGLGAAAVHSSLGRPLEIAIPVYLQRGERLSQLTALLAPAAAFTKAGIPYPAYAKVLKLTVARGRSGEQLLITTSRPVNDPIVQLLVRLHLGPVNLQRTVTALLDPPASPRRSAAVAARPAVVTVRRGDTLGRIALRLTGDFGRPLNQVMVALFRANPNAFIGGNMNRLKAGARLIVPQAAAVRRVAPGRAAAAVKRQYAEFAAGPTAAPTATPEPPHTLSSAPALPGPAASAADGGPPPPSPPRLRISSGAPTPVAEGSDSLRTQLAAVQKLNRSLAEQNAILREQVNLLAQQAKLLAQQIKTMDRLAALSARHAVQPAAGRVPQNAHRAAAVVSAAAPAKSHGTTEWRLWWLLPLVLLVAVALLWRYRQGIPLRRVRL